jgi:carbon storage regulator CsrA
MLVLTRKIDEEIIVGDNIRLRILSTRGNSVRVGIEAPPSVHIKRGELADADQPRILPRPGEWTGDSAISLPAHG